jgi:hypothetical protein
MKLNTPSGRRILMKHAVSYIEILEQTPDWPLHSQRKTFKHEKQ